MDGQIGIGRSTEGDWVLNTHRKERASAVGRFRVVTTRQGRARPARRTPEAPKHCEESSQRYWYQICYTVLGRDPDQNETQRELRRNE